jgi:RND family efflux transporter MFP subunit
LSRGGKPSVTFGDDEKTTGFKREESKVRVNLRRLLLYAGIIVIGLFVFWFAVLSPREVMVAPVSRHDVTAEVQGSGTITANRLAKVGSKINGRVEKLLVDERDFVREGQIVATLDDTDLRWEVERTRAQLAAARAEAWEAQRAWEREKRLLVAGAVSQEEADGYERRYSTAEQAVKAAEAQLRFRQYKLSEARIPSLITGIVTKRWVELGDTVVPGQAVFTVAGSDIIQVDANVDQRFAGKIHAGKPATVLLRGRESEAFAGRVYRVNPEADPSAEEMTVEVAFPLPAKEIQIGQWADVYIQVRTIKDALAVPRSSILTMGNDHFVFVVDGRGRLRQTKVKITASSPRASIAAVEGDLKGGDRVALMPMGLRSGEKVRAKDVPTSGGPMSGQIGASSKR